MCPRLVTFLLLAALIPTASVSSKEQCPSPCECKWKKGKETLTCPEVNFRNIPTMQEHSGIQVLDFPGNHIRILRDEIFIESNLLNLQELYLSSCHIEKVENYAFRDLINLVRLDLSSNSLTVVPKKALEGVTQLRDLFLSRNPIRRIKNYAFSSLNQLIKLELSECKIDWIEPYAFNGLETLRRLKIDGNRLKELNPAVWYPLRNSLYGINLHANPWNCSCSLRRTLEWIRTANVPPTIPPVCASPLRLRRKSWNSLRERDFACSPVVVLLTTSSSDSRNITLTCRIRGDPLVDINWLKEGAPLFPPDDPFPGNSSSASRRKYILREFENPNSYEKTSNLTFLSDDADSGTYRCSGKNAAGSVSESIRLTNSNSILGGTPVTTLRKRSSRGHFYLVLGSLGIGSLLFICLFGACCLYGFHRRSKPSGIVKNVSNAYINSNGTSIQGSGTHPHQNGIELQSMLKGDESCNEAGPEEVGSNEKQKDPQDLMKYNDGYDDNENGSLTNPSEDFYVEIEPVMKSELLATARETEIRGVSTAAQKTYPQRAFLSYRLSSVKEEEGDQLLSNRSYTLDGRSSSVYRSNSRTHNTLDDRRRYSSTDNGGHPKIKTFLKEYHQLQSQFSRLRDNQNDGRDTLLIHSSQREEPSDYVNPMSYGLKGTSGAFIQEEEDEEEEESSTRRNTSLF